MKKVTFFSLFLLVAVGLSAQNIVFVKHNATGGNNGSSWANAYNELESALDAATPGTKIWVAAGTYVPQGGTLDNSFSVLAGVELYGGFAGTETALSERNIGANPTILSGDVLGDDLDNDFSTGRADNRLHVVRVVSGLPANRAIIDGFTIKGGNASVVATDPEINRRGGGIYAAAKLTVRNCNFNNNRAESGAGIMVPGVGGSGLEVYNCIFEKSSATVRAAGIYFIGLTGATIRKCAFRDNSTTRGAFYPRSSVNVVLDSSSFVNNVDIAPDGFGGAIFSWQNNIDITNTEFIGNSSGSGSAVYLDNRELGKFATLKNCTFDANIATDYGGNGLFAYRQNYSMDNCIFKNHIAPSSGAAIYNSDSISFEIKNTLIESNSGQWGAAIANYGEACIGIYDNCTFKANTAANGGGAVSNGFRADITYKDCTFDSNTGRIGGAIFSQNDTTRMTISGCTFTNNAAQESGGCIYQNVNIATTIENSDFSINSANIGGAIYATGDSAMHITATKFSDNLGIEQAAALYVINGDVTLTNCLMVRNLNVSASGAGGAIGNNASDGRTSSVKAINCTIADNLAPLGAGIAQWEDSDTSTAVLTLHNCLLQNVDGENYTIEANTPTVISLGGNQSSDDSAAAELVAAKDKNATENQFMDADNGDYHLLTGPALDGGVAAGAPTKDLDGNDRVGDPDSGCYELGTSGVFQPAVVALPLQLAPNPAVSQTTLSIRHTTTGEGVLDITTHDGRVVSSIAVNKNSENWQYNLAVAHLPVGTYRVTLRINGVVYAGSLVKN